MENQEYLWLEKIEFKSLKFNIKIIKRKKFPNIGIRDPQDFAIADNTSNN